MLKGEWHSRVEFAEVAETLGVDTDQVMGTLVKKDQVVTIWTEQDRVLCSRLSRDIDGVLLSGIVHTLEVTVPELHAKVMKILSDPEEHREAVDFWLGDPSFIGEIPEDEESDDDKEE